MGVLYYQYEFKFKHGSDNHPKQSISIDVNVNAIGTMLINGIDQISNYQKK